MTLSLNLVLSFFLHTRTHNRIYSLDENQMLTVTLDMMLVTPDIASGTIKQIHISLATSPLNSTTDPMSGYTTVNVSHAQRVDHLFCSTY